MIPVTRNLKFTGLVIVAFTKKEKRHVSQKVVVAVV